MFETLEKQIEQSEGGAEPTSRRVIKYLLIFVVTVIVFGGLYLAIRLVEG